LEQSIEINKNEEKLKKITSIYLNKKEIIDNYFIQEGLLEILDSEWDALLNFNLFLNDPFQEGLKPIDLPKVNSIIQNISSMIEKSNKDKQYINKDVKENSDDSKSVEFDFNDILFNKASIPATSGLSFSTRLIDGTSTLIVNKIKTELSISFYEKMKEKFNKNYFYKIENDSVNLNFKHLLFNTFTLIDTKQSFEVPAFGSTWISAFQKDLSQLPFSIMDQFKMNPNFMKLKKGRYAAVIYEGMNQLYNGFSITSTLELLQSQFNDIEENDIDFQIALLNLIYKNSAEIESNSDSKIGNYLLLNEKGKKYLAAMLYLDGKESGLNKNNSFLINENNYNLYYELVKDVQLSMKNILTTTNKLKSKTTNTNDFTVYAGLFMNLINKMYEFEAKNSNYVFYNTQYYNEFIPISGNIIGFYDGLEGNNLGSGMLSTICFLNNLSPDKKNSKLISDITFYGSFITDMVMASSNENTDIEQILNKYAMPVTSYRVKRYYKSSIDISAYPGINFGYEFSNSKSPSFGISAPIGFSFSWRSKNVEDIYVSSHSIFISALDLGAPVSYRLIDDSANGLPENIKWEQVFSPGIFYVYGFKNAPLCLSVGLQYTPLLRKIETESIVEEQNVIKAGVSLMVDLPLFSLYKNSKNVE
jgi:hypothetical protein